MNTANALMLLPRNGTPADRLLTTKPARAAIALQILRVQPDSADRQDLVFAQAHNAYRRAGFRRTHDAPRLLAVA